MRVTPDDISKLALKLIEVFSRSGTEDHNFGRYWRIVPPLQTFLESAVGPFEEEVAKSLLAAVEGASQTKCPELHTRRCPSRGELARRT